MVELLTHITRVIKQSPGISLPVDQLVTLLAKSSNNFVLASILIWLTLQFNKIELYNFYVYIF